VNGAEDLTVGILGGTFDPVHIGHLIVAEEIRVRCNLQKILFVCPFSTPTPQGCSRNHTAPTEMGDGLLGHPG